MSVFEARAAGWDEGFQKLHIARYFLKKPEGSTANVLVGMLLIVQRQYLFPFGTTNILTRSFRMALLRFAKSAIVIRTPKTNAPDKDHLLLQLPGVIVFWTDLPVEVQ